MAPDTKNSLITDDNIFRPPINPIRFLSKYINKVTLNIAAIEVARANPPCFKGPMRIKFRTIFNIMEYIPTLAGVLVSCNE